MIAVDVGGTFTDVVSFKDGRIDVAKISTDYKDVTAPVIEGAALLGVENSPVFNHASTHGLNAVITRRLPKIGFLATEGHRDILDMGRVWRPASAILDPHWRRSFGDADRPLIDRYLRRGIRERVMADGRVLIGLNEEQAREQLEVLRRCNVEGVAICLLHAYANPAHERRLRDLAREVLGDIPMSISSDVSPLAKEYARASTTAIDTFMKIIYADYSQQLDSGLAAAGFTGDLNFADCAATLVPAKRAMEQPFRIVFSGPSAGTVASAHFGALIGEENLICADVGGTSCDISIVTDGKPFVNTTFELEHDLIVNALASDITAIGAGGGSLIGIGSSGEITVGPGSAGASPGPACYGRGGTQPTTTDLFVMTGIVDPEGFADGKVDLDRDLARKAFENLATDMPIAQRIRFAFEIAVNNIAEGVFNVAIKKGVDPRDYSLTAYGAAGPMLLPAIMDVIHCKQVIVPPNPGLFSALGLLSADQVFTVSRSVYTRLDADAADHVARIFAEQEDVLRADLDTDLPVVFERSMDARLVGQSWETPFVPVPNGDVDAATIARMIAAFHDTYEQRTGNRFEHLDVEGVTFRVRAIIDTPKVSYSELTERESGAAVPVKARRTLRYLDDTGEEGMEANIYDREALCRGDCMDGPAVIVERLSTTFVGPRQRVAVGRYGELIITKK